MASHDPFDFAETCRAIAMATSPEDLARVIGGDPRKQRLADRLAAVVAEAPPVTPEQRAAIAAVLRGAARQGCTDAA